MSECKIEIIWNNISMYKLFVLRIFTSIKFTWSYNYLYIIIITIYNANLF